MSTISDLEIITDMFCDDTIYDGEDEILEQKPKAYYHGKAIYIKKQLSKDNYFHFLESFLTDFKELNEQQKGQLKEIMNIQPEIIIKEKVVNVVKTKKNNKPKVNVTDDY
tara:strand:+ start:2655 stop:2984 length:330 start_codon:yes stop_codon:yes gene_type:complete